jgi:putative phosphoribosyl transferase
MVFADRDDAGRRLASRLGHLRGEPAVVLGLARGGVPVAFQVARALGVALDVIVVRKLGVPQQPELAMGAVGEGGVRAINRQVVRMAGVPEKVLAAVVARERAAVEARAGVRCRARWPRQPLHGRTAVVVDDGIATGATARAACQVARAHGAARVVLAVPVAPRGWQAEIGGDADEMVCVETPAVFFAIGQHYASFPQVADDEVLACQQRAPLALQAAPAGGPRAAGNADPSARDERVEPVRCRKTAGSRPRSARPFRLAR